MVCLRVLCSRILVAVYSVLYSYTHHWLLVQHHCRLCGGVFCDDCTEQRLQLPGAMLVSQPGASSIETAKVVRARVCQRCFGLYRTE